MEQDGTRDAFFTGNYDHTLDVKGRVSLPAKFRRNLPVELKIVPKGNTVMIFTTEGFRAYVDDVRTKLADLAEGREAAIAAARFALTSSAEDTEIDSAGRISISSKVRQNVGLEKDVSIVGAVDHIELMNRDVYAARLAAAQQFLTF
ncbi:MAG: hypothetical protein KHY83_01525 [Coriobacteriia bacterium]|nr:hypothetical protein [Coriobacteriia bacterium]MBS5477330.1 hypothetical protein [Coriobacteriia bacterium]